jgi:hypothetical protein
MKNAIKVFFLMTALFQGSTAIGLDVTVVTVPEKQEDVAKLKGVYTPKLVCNGIVNQLPMNSPRKCTLEENQKFSVWRGQTDNRMRHECSFILQNNELKKAYCSPHWHPVIKAEGIIFKYSDHGY